MKASEIFLLAIDAIRERRLRSSLTILMIVIGASLMVSLNGMNAGFTNFVDEQLSVLAPNVITVTPSSLLKRNEFGGETKKITLGEQTARTLSLIPGVKEVAPFFSGTVKVKSGGKVQPIRLVGIDSQKLLLVSPGLKPLEGRLVAPGDTVGITLGYSVVHVPGEEQPFTEVGRTIVVEYSYLEYDGPVPRTITVKRSFAVRGVLEETGNPLIDKAAYVTPSAANRLLKKSMKYDGIYLVTESIERNDFVIERVRQIYGEDIGVTSPALIKKTIESLLSGVRLFILSIASVSMVVGGVGIVTTLFTSVMERVREIGTLKALGCRNRDVLMMFLSEALIMGVIGGGLGLIGGMAAGYTLLTSVKIGPGGVTFKPVFLPQDLAFVWVLAVLLSIIAGLYPAWRASKLPPIVALRRE